MRHRIALWPLIAMAAAIGRKMSPAVEAAAMAAPGAQVGKGKGSPFHGQSRRAKLRAVRRKANPLYRRPKGLGSQAVHAKRRAEFQRQQQVAAARARATEGQAA